ncbi:MAG: PhoX family phosphatase, partial [Pseudomonadota bacterium]|nr:PhoX family phosphatase [Pseudomonadota bacterium]
DQVDVGMAAMGHGVVEIELKNGKWQPVANSTFNRRITSFSEITVSGPAAGHALMKTSEDQTGTKVIGTGANCGGGITPWGTILACEEFPYSYFGGDPAKTDQGDHIKRIGMESEDYYGQARFYDRYNVEKEPNELNRWQWVVEIDPYEPNSAPVKRTALGRTGHEGATVVINKDRRVAVYMGDDDYFEYLYRFVSKNSFNPSDRTANMSLLDEGTLAVAKFEADGSLRWLPLVHGQGPLTAQNGFADQGEVLIKCRQAADKLGATPMDRPEDFETNPSTGRVYAVLTKNKKRKKEEVNPVNSRPENNWGHIVELIPPGEGNDTDHGAEVYKWDILILCGDPGKPDQGAKFHPETSADGWFVTPDNIAFDPKGRMWVATDGQNDFALADGIFGIDTEGPGRGLPKALFCAPTGAEVTGPAFTPDGRTMFVSVQHPAEDSETIEKLTTRWPDFQDGMPPRPAVVAIRREDGGEIGGA